MTGRTRRGWRRVLAQGLTSGAVAAGLLLASGPGIASADVLDDIGAKYMQGAGGGQLSNFVKEALQMRSQGFKPSKGNLEALQAGWDYLPNQSRLVDALKETVSYQRMQQARQQNAKAPSSGLTIGANQLPPGVPPDPTNPDNTGVFLGPTGGFNQPVG